MAKTSKVIKGIIMTLIVVAGVLIISELMITILTVSETLLSGEMVNENKIFVEWFLKQSSVMKMVLLLMAELMIPGIFLGIGGFIVMLVRSIKDGNQEELEEYEGTNEEFDNE